MEEDKQPEAGEDDALPRAFGGYTLLATIGHGGMGSVYLATRENIAGIARRCVVKTLRPGFGDDREYVTRFLDEARIVAQLHHRCICPVFDVGKVNAQHYLAMEYIAGRDLRTFLKRAVARGIVLERVLVLHVIAELLEALDYAHRLADPATGASLALVHRDVSPQNVMIGFEGDVRLIDFGLAASTMKTEHTAPNTVMGKVAYMSPEQIYGEHIDGRADQFAAAVIAYELLMGERYYETRPAREVYTAAAHGRFRPKRFNDLPADIRTVLDKALSFARDDRYATCGEMREELLVGHSRGDASGLRKMMTTLFPDEIVEEKRLLARVASSSSYPVATPAPSSGPAASSGAAASGAERVGAAAAVTAEPLGAASLAAGEPTQAETSASEVVEDSTRATGSARTARGQEPTTSVRRSSGTAPDRPTFAPPPRWPRFALAAAGFAVLTIAVAFVASFALRHSRDDMVGSVAALEPPVTVVTAPPVNAPVVTAPPVTTSAPPLEVVPVVPAPVAPVAPVRARPRPKAKPDADSALPGVVIRYLEVHCPTAKCAAPLVARKGDWATMPIKQLRADLRACLARCE